MNNEDRKITPFALEKLLSGLMIPEALAADFAGVNLAASTLRALPATILGGDLRREADQLLGQHLPRLLRAYGEARRAAPTDLHAGNDDLARGLHHVRSELARIGDACRDQTDTSLSTEARFLELRYPSETAPASSAETTSQRSVPIKASNIRDLIAGPIDRWEAPPTTASVGQRRWWPTIALPPLNAETLTAGISLALLGIGALAIMGSFARDRHEKHAQQAEKELARALRPKIDIARIFRGPKEGRISYGRIVGTYGATVAFTGHVVSATGVPIRELTFDITLYDCPSPTDPWSQCLALANAPTTAKITRRGEKGTTYRFDDSVSLDAPNSSGTMRARIIYTGASLTPNELDGWYHARTQ